MISPIDEIKNRLDIVEVISQYIKLKKCGVNFRALCPFHTEKKPSFFVSPSRQIWHCFGCFPAKSLIKTENGFHPIEEIRVGQRVLTHKGRFMPVIRTLWRPYKGQMIEIKIRKSNEVISLTEDHEVYVIQTKHCKYKSRLTRICQWNCKRCKNTFWENYKIEKLPASKISRDDFLLYPINQEIKDVEIIDLDKYYDRKESNFGPEIGEIPTKIRVDEKLLKLIGYYIAEGSNHRAYIRFSLGNHEKDFAKEIKNLIKEIFEIKASIHKRKEGRTGLEISACNSKLSNIFENLCGKGAENKHIPFEFQHLPPEKQRIILDAIYKGDGAERSVAKCKRDRKYKYITTISLILAEQLRDILLRLKIAPTFYIQKEKVDKEGVHHKKAFTIRWQEDYILHYSQFYRDPNTNVLYWISPIKEIKKRHFEGDVYNLTVAEDHSYMTPNFIVGNCGRGGDIFAFIKEIEGVEFGDALRILAQKAGVELKRQDPKLKTQRQRLYEICELATQFFEKQLEGSSTGQKAKQYLLNRQISEESIKKWRLGYAPDTWQSLTDFLSAKGYKREEIAKAGLAMKSSNIEHKTPNNYFDRFRGRIMFPVFDLNSQVIGFGGRIFQNQKEGVAKYINCPNTLLYDKSKILYGLDKAKVEIRKKNFCILAEGYTDVIMSHQAGFENTVATSGTALTSYQLRILKRYSENLLTAFDMDIAGNTATKRGVDLALLQGFEVKVITMPQGLDPADIISKNPTDWQKLVKKARSILEFYFENTLSRFDPKTPDGKKEISKILLPIIKKIPNKILQAHWIQKLSRILKIKEEVIELELKKISSQKIDSPSWHQDQEFQLAQPSSKSRRELLEERILSLLLKFPQKLDLISEDHLPLFSSRAKDILINFRKDPQFESVTLSEKDDYFLNYLFLKGEVETDFDPDFEIKTCVQELQSMDIKEKLAKISVEIKRAEEEGDTEKLTELIKEFNKLANRLASNQ